MNRPVPQRHAMAEIPAFARDLCLAYANTRYWRGTATPTESLSAIGDLLQWLQGAGHDPGVLADAAAWASADPKAAAVLFGEAIALREVIYRLFSAVADRRPAAEEDLAALNRALAATPARRRLARAGLACAWRVDYGGPSMPVLLAPVLWSAADLLVAGGQDRLRQCANDQCLWLFLDDSKSATRRWCDMKACGNRLKARRHYLRTKGARGQSDASGAPDPK